MGRECLEWIRLTQDTDEWRLLWIPQILLGRNYAACKISGFRREVDVNWALLGYYAAFSGDFLPTFRDNLSVPSSHFWPLKLGLIGYPETSIRNYYYVLRNSPKEHSSALRVVRW